MNKKRFSLIAILPILVLMLAACAPAASQPKVALMLARGGLGDKAFNDGANAGLQRAADELGTETKTFDYQDGDAQLEVLRQAAKDGYNPIIALGSENANAVGTLAAEFPKLSFVIIDTT